MYFFILLITLFWTNLVYAPYPPSTNIHTINHRAIIRISNNQITVLILISIVIPLIEFSVLRAFSSLHLITESPLICDGSSVSPHLLGL
jgi:hypothetical protein